MSLQSLIQSKQRKLKEQFRSFPTRTLEEGQQLVDEVSKQVSQAMTDTAKEMAEAIKLEKKKVKSVNPTEHVAVFSYNQAKSELDEKINKFLDV